MANDAEGTLDYLQEAGDQQGALIYRDELDGDRACLWGEAHTLVIRSCPVPTAHPTYLHESNPRRTSTTSIHEFAQFHFGANDLERLVLLSDDGMESGAIADIEQLQSTLGDLLYTPASSTPHGVVITIASCLEFQQLGCLLIAPTTTEALVLHRQVQDRVR